MSIRTIIEINHDNLYQLKELNPEALQDFLHDITNCNGALNNSNGSGHRADYGVTVLSSHHHSNKVALAVDHRIVFRNYLDRSKA